MLTRRQFAHLLAAAVVAAPVAAPLLEACGTATTALAGPKRSTGPAQMRMTWWGGPNRASLTNALFNLFEREHQQYSVVGSYQTLFADYWPALATSIAAGIAADLVQMDVVYIAQYAESATLLDLTLYAGRQIDLEGIDGKLLAQGQVGGRLYGIPIAANTQATIVDNDLLNRAGVDALPRDWTWTSLANFMVRLAGLLPPGTWPMDDGAGSGIALRVFIRQRGGDLYTATGQLGVSRQDMLDWFKYWQDLRNSGALVPVDHSQEGVPSNPSTTLAATNQVVFTFDWSNQLAAYMSYTNANLSLAPIPRGPAGSPRGSYLKASQLLSVTTSTKFPSQAVQFIDFWINDPGAARILGVDRGLPVTPRASRTVRPLLTTTERAEVDFLSGETRGSALALREPPGSSLVLDALTQSAMALARGKITVAEAADQFIRWANAALTGQSD